MILENVYKQTLDQITTECHKIHLQDPLLQIPIRGQKVGLSYIIITIQRKWIFNEYTEWKERVMQRPGFLTTGPHFLSIQRYFKYDHFHMIFLKSLSEDQMYGIGR